MLTIEQLEAFRTIIRAGTYSRAADQLFLTQPAISQRISHLERALGVALFHRQGNRRALRLTGAGRYVFRFADDVLGRLEQLRVDVKIADKLKQEETVTIATAPLPAQYIVPALQAAFHERHPDTPVNVIQTGCDNIGPLIKAGEVDFGILPDIHVDDGFPIVPLIPDHLVLIVPPDFPDPAELEEGEGRNRQLPFLVATANPDVRKAAKQWASSLHMTLNVLAETRSLDVVKACVAQGLGLSIVPELSVRNEVREGYLRTLPAPGKHRKWQFCLIYDAETHLASAAEDFLEVVQEKAWRAYLPALDYDLATLAS